MAMIGDNWKTELVGPANYIKVEPTCPCGGTYTVTVTAPAYAETNDRSVAVLSGAPAITYGGIVEGE
mgnify:CR=1 FL=1